MSQVWTKQIKPSGCCFSSRQNISPPLQHAGHIQAFAHELDLSDLLGPAAGGQFPLQQAADLHPAHIGEGATFEIARTSRTMD